MCIFPFLSLSVPLCEENFSKGTDSGHFGVFRMLLIVKELCVGKGQKRDTENGHVPFYVVDYSGVIRRKGHFHPQTVER